MTYDGFDFDFDNSDDPVVLYGVPGDHPAFRAPQDDGDDDGDFPPTGQHDGINDAVGGSVIDFPVGRYDGFAGQDQQEVVGVVRTDESRQRAADAQFLRDRLDATRRDVATRAIGQRNAIAHTRSPSEGEGGGTKDGEPSLHDALAASLEQAGVRFRDERGRDGSGDNPAIGDPVKAFLNGPEVVKERGGWQKSLPSTQPLTRAKRGILEAPKFQSAVMVGSMGGLKLNVAGTWVLTLHIDADSFEEVTKLSTAHGLALDITVKRKARSE